jgi:hypothetical protein
MAKESYYFSHDYHARNDKKLIKLKQKFKMSGIGIFWCLTEMLYEEGGKLSLADLDMIALELKEKNTRVLAVVNDFELFKNDGSFFWSESVNSRLGKRLEKTVKAKASAEERWRKANAMRTHSDGNAIKERKGKEIKGKENSDSNSTTVVSVGAEAPAPPVNQFKQISKDEFFKELATYTPVYPKEMLRAFFDYWSEMAPSGKMKFQLEKTWETKKRLVTWHSKDQNFKPNGSHFKTPTTNGRSSVGKKSEGAARLAEELRDDLAINAQ